MQVLRPVAIATALLLVSHDRLRSEEPLPTKIDRHIDARLQEEGVTPAAQADDVALIRRLTLDLVGRIPTWSEVEAYTKATDPNKRAQLTDRLMNSPAFARYQAYLFEVMLGDKSERGGRSNVLRDYLATALKEKRSWEQIFRELMLPDETNPKLKGSSEFLRPRLNDADRLTNDVSIAFFGVNVSCAQCHDHPLVHDWKQDHFYGMKSFLARSYEVNGVIGERGAGLIRFKPNKGAEKPAKMMFLTGQPVEHSSIRELTSEESKQEKIAKKKGDKPDDKNAPPKPEFSAREKLVTLAIEDKRFLSRSIVNRLWHRFLGFGLVNPLDQMHSENSATHPALLDELAKEMVDSKFDLNKLIRGIVLSQTYSRSSVYQSAAHPVATLFAVAPLRALTPQQLAVSLKIATQDPESLAKLSPVDFEKRIEGYENETRGFAGMIAQPTENFQIGVGEALLFSNGERIAKEFLTNGNGTLLKRTEAVPSETAIKLMVNSVLGRQAQPNELAVMTKYLGERKDRKAEARKQLLWALSTCPEFRFNH